MLIRDTFMLLEELAVEQDKDTCIIDLKLTCGPTMWPINVYECDSPPLTHTQTETHTIVLVLVLVYSITETELATWPPFRGWVSRRQQDWWSCWQQGNQPYLHSCMALQYSGVLIYGLARPIRWWRWGTALGDGIRISVFLVAAFIHIPNVFYPCSVAHRYLPACAVVVHQHAYKTLPSTWRCCNWQAQWRSYQHSSWEGMC